MVTRLGAILIFGLRCFWVSKNRKVTYKSQVFYFFAGSALVVNRRKLRDWGGEVNFV